MGPNQICIQLIKLLIGAGIFKLCIMTQQRILNWRVKKIIDGCQPNMYN